LTVRAHPRWYRQAFPCAKSWASGDRFPASHCTEEVDNHPCIRLSTAFTSPQLMAEASGIERWLTDRRTGRFQCRHRMPAPRGPELPAAELCRLTARRPFRDVHSLQIDSIATFVTSAVNGHAAYPDCDVSPSTFLNSARGRLQHASLTMQFALLRVRSRGADRAARSQTRAARRSQAARRQAMVRTLTTPAARSRSRGPG
jgi:hypothetical protein